MKKWEEFKTLVEGLDLFDAVESFFSYTESIDADSAMLLQGIDYLTVNGRPILALFITKELFLAIFSEEGEDIGKLNPVILSYAKIKDLMNGLPQGEGADVLQYLLELRDEYPEAFAILDEKSSGNA